MILRLLFRQIYKQNINITSGCYEAILSRSQGVRYGGRRGTNNCM